MLDTKALADATAAIVREHVERATAPLLQRIVDLEARSLPAPEKGEPGERGQDGKDGRDGADGTAGDPGADGRNGIDGTKGADGKDGRDGVGLAGALIDRSGGLVVTLSDGTTRELGPVIGKDGADGHDGAAGRDGQNGIDGLGFDDLAVEHDGERGFVFRFAQGDRAKEFKFSLPVVIDRGVFKDGSTYHPGDGVTWAGSYWIAQKETAAKPDSGDGFRLAVKRGRDGKAADAVRLA